MSNDENCEVHADRSMSCMHCNKLFNGNDAQILFKHYEAQQLNESSQLKSLCFHCVTQQPASEQPTPRPNEWNEDVLQSIAYCWNCATGDTNLQCSSCPRHFHLKCVETNTEPGWKCNECTKDNDFEPVDMKFIPMLFVLIGTDEDFEPLRKLRFTNKQTIKAVDYSKMKHTAYQTIGEFEDDLIWFHHNCRTILPRRPELHDSAEKLIEWVKENIPIINTCEECFEKTVERCGNYDVTKQCSKLHLLLWARVEGYRCWPAKVKNVNVADQTVHVQFFGDLTSSTVPCRNCYLYSIKNPDKKKGNYLKSYGEALKDVDEYIQFIRAKFGNFNYAKDFTDFKPEKFDDYLNDMIAKQPNSTPNVLEVRKRTARSKSLHASRVKIARIESDYGDIFNLMAMNFTQGLQSMKRLHDDNTQMIANLRIKLTNTSNEKMVLEQKNARLIEGKNAIEEEHRKLVDEKKILEKKLAESEEAKRKEKNIFDAKYAELEAAKCNKKKALEEKIAVMERNKTKKACAYCRTDLDALVFCNDECGKKYYTMPR